MVGEIYGGLHGFKAVLDSLKAVVNIRDEVLRGEASIKLVRDVIQLQGEVSSAYQEKAALAEKVRALEAEIAQLKAGASDLERYELKNIGGGAMAYMLKADARGTEPPHWLCPTCYSQRKKSIYQYSVSSGRGSIYRCGGCDGHVTAHGGPEWVK
jgi:hypothetical protein